MELYDEEVKQKNSKASMIIGICIILLVIMTILIFVGIIYLKKSITMIHIDAVRNYEIEKILYIESTEEKTELYIPIIKMAQFLGYEGFKGDYLNKSEDNTKCHVTSENETAMFTLNSDLLVKVTANSEIEYVKLDKPVFEKNGELYTTIDGIKKAFNVMFSSDQKFKNINIYNMDYLIKYYADLRKITTYSTHFTDKKAILENMMIIQNDNKYGVIDVANNGKSILEVKYDEIKYLPATSDFLVKNNGKYGIMTKDAVIKVKMVYDEIKTMDNIKGLYLVKQNGAYGVVNNSGETIIKSEYLSIGIDIDKYTQNGIKNSFILLDEIIPVKNTNELWGFFNTKGEQITEFEYTGLGCIPTVVSTYPILAIPEKKIIVVQQDKYYNLITNEGEQLIQNNTLNSVYIKVDSDTEEKQYFMTYNNNQKVINIEEWLEKKDL